MVLRAPIRKARWVYQKLANDVREECPDADATAAGRSGYDRSDWSEPAVLPWAETVRRKNGPRSISEGRSRLKRGKTSGRSAASHRRLVRRECEIEAGRHQLIS